MPTRAELLEEANRRGILPHDKRDAYDEAVRRGLIGRKQADAPTSTFDARPFRDVARSVTDSKEWGKISESLNNREEGVDYYTGLGDFSARASFSRMDTDEERASFLTKNLGLDGWGKDKYGNYIITPAGLDRAGIAHNNKPIAIDEHRLTWNDIADMRGDAPAILGATAAGIATGGAGFLPAVGAAALGAAGAKGYDEAADALRGDNLQGAGDTAAMLAKEGGFAALGEVGYRGVMRPLGRKLMAPEAKRMTEEGRQILRDSADIGVQPDSTQVTKAPLLGRFQNMAHKIFENPKERANAKAIIDYMNGLKSKAGPPAGSGSDLADDVASSIIGRRRRVGDIATKMYGRVDSLAGGRKIIPTSPLKKTANEIIEALPKSQDGSPVLTSPETVKLVSQISNLEDSVTTAQMQEIRHILYDAMHDDSLLPGVAKGRAKLLWKAANQSFEEAAKSGNDPAISALRRADAFYKKEVSKFNDALVSKIIKDPSQIGSIEPEFVAGAIFKKGMANRIRRVRGVVDEETWGKVRRASMENILGDIIEQTDDPLISVFNGKKLVNVLDRYGRESLDEMFGPEMTKDLYKFANVAKLANFKVKGGGPGGLVAASIAMRPLQNLGRLIKINLLIRAMDSRAGLQYLTEGLVSTVPGWKGKTIAGVRASGDALTRLGMMFAALDNEETGPGYWYGAGPESASSNP